MLRARLAGSWKRAVLLLVFTLSGASGLIYEVLWTRRLTHIFGSTTLAVSTVLAAFMGGLAVGSGAVMGSIVHSRISSPEVERDTRMHDCPRGLQGSSQVGRTIQEYND